jgi:S1-C subfamily serine protease
MKHVFVCFLLVALAQAQSTANIVPASQDSIRQSTAERANLLRELDSSLEQVVSRVSPAVVQILVNGYGLVESHGRTDTARIVRQHAIGSGLIVDPNGYIITNAHVVEGTQRVRSEAGGPRDAAQFVAQSESQGATRNCSAHILEWILQERNGMRDTTAEEQPLQQGLHICGSFK